MNTSSRIDSVAEGAAGRITGFLKLNAAMLTLRSGSERPAVAEEALISVGHFRWHPGSSSWCGGRQSLGQDAPYRVRGGR